MHGVWSLSFLHTHEQAVLGVYMSYITEVKGTPSSEMGNRKK